jgi:hypothetical protein
MLRALPTAGQLLLPILALAVAYEAAVAAPDLRCEEVSAAGAINVSWAQTADTDMYYVGIHELNHSKLIALDTVAGRDMPGRMHVVLSQLAEGTSYALLLRSHPSTLPSTVWGWRNVSAASTPVVCKTNEVRKMPERKLGPSKSRFTRMYRVSELTYEIDFLSNHNAADLRGSVAFLSSGSPDGAPAFSKVPVTEYCVEHLDSPWAPYVSCNGPEAGNRSTPMDPICICDVYADRMIALESMSTMDYSCGRWVNGSQCQGSKCCS